MAKQNNYPIFENNSTVITAEFLNGLVNNVKTLNQEDGVFDISIANAVSGVPTTYNSLELALSGTNIPVDIRKGGLAVKFINSTSEKYESWNLKASSWSTDTSDWALDVDGSVTDGKLKLPFPLAKPNPDTFVTQASELGYGGTPVACGLVYDISVAHAVSDVPAQYESLSAALGTNGANIPQDVRRGGMTVKFINSGSGKYEQWNLKTSSWSTNTSDWELDTNAFNILTEAFNDGFYYPFANLSVGDTAPLNTVTHSDWTCCKIPVKAGETYRVICTGGNNGRAYALTDTNRVILSIAESDLSVNDIITIQQDGYLYINSGINNFHFVSLNNISHVLGDIQGTLGDTQDTLENLISDLSRLLPPEVQLTGTFVAHGTLNKDTGAVIPLEDSRYNVYKYPCTFGKQYRIVTGRASSDSSTRAYAYSYSSNDTPVSLIRDTTNVDDEFIYEPSEEVTYIQVYSSSDKPQYVYEIDIDIVEKVNGLKDEVYSLSSKYIDIISIFNVAKSILIANYYYPFANLSVGDTAPSTPVAHSDWTCCKIPVKTGDKILLNIQGGNSGRAYALTDSDNKILTLADANATIFDTLTINQSGYLYINNIATFSAIIIESFLFDSIPSLISQVNDILQRLTVVENDTSDTVTYTSEDLYADGDDYKSYYYGIVSGGVIRDPLPTSPIKFTSSPHPGATTETEWGCLPIIELNPGITITIRTKGGGNGRAYAIADMSNHPLIVADAGIDTRSNPFVYTTETKCKLWVNTQPNNDEDFSVIIRKSIKGDISGLQNDVDTLKESISNIVSDASAISNQPIDIRKDSKTTLRVLDIGNSFTIDPTEMLPGLVNSANLDISDMCLYRMIRGGGSWKTFYDSWHNTDNYNGNVGCHYSTSRLLGGQTQPISGSTNYDRMQSAIKDCQWDLIIIHQVSTYSAAYELWDGNTDAGYFLEFLRILRTYQPQASIGFLMGHCSYRQSSGDTATLFAEAARSTKQAVSRCNINFVIPVAAAIENLRASAAMSVLYPNVHYGYSRDEHHLGYGLARYTAACTYFQCVFGKRYGQTVFGNSYRYHVTETSEVTHPDENIDVTNDNAPTAQVCAMLAYEDMYNIHNPDGILSTL